VEEDQVLLPTSKVEAAPEVEAQAAHQVITVVMDQQTVAVAVAVALVLTQQVVVQVAEVDQVLLL
jgi:hypothetical protein